MDKKIIDISVSINEKLPVWPGSPGAEIKTLMKIGPESVANVSHISIESHTGTHIDAPLHFIKDGHTTAEIALSTLIGTCQVLYIPDVKSIGPDELKKIPIEKGIKRVLLKTDNQILWDKKEYTFEEDYCALNAEGAQYLVDKGIELVGIDYLSIQRFHDPIDTHVILLKNDVVILETIDLRSVEAGIYRLICLPLKIEGIEGCPVRAVLETI